MKYLNEKIVFFVVLTFSIYLTGCSMKETVNSPAIEPLQEEEQNPIYLSDGTVLYPDGSMDLGEGSWAHGLYNADHDILDPGELLYTNGNKIICSVDMAQNIKGNTDYILFIMCDYVQQEFLVDGDSYTSYRFSLQDNSEVSINIELPYSDDMIELECLIFLNPDVYELSLEEWAEFDKTSLIFSKRVFINRVPEQLDYTLDTSYNIKESDINISCMLTKSISTYTLMPECQSNDIVQLIYGNTYERDLECVLVAFYNWEQVPIVDNNPYIISKIDSNQNFYYNIRMPENEKDSTYQVVMFYQPFTQEYNNYWSAISTHRTIIKN